MKIDEARLRELIPDAERLLFGDAIPAEYRSDALGRLKGTADALIFPLSTEEVSGVLRYAHENRVPVTPRGAGTNLVGSTVPLFGGIILDLSRMDRVLELDEDTMTVTVESGILLRDGPVRVEGLDVAWELFFEITPSFAQWRKTMWEDRMPFLQMSFAQMLPTMLVNTPYWTILPLSTARSFASLYPLKDYELRNGPEPRICSIVTHRSHRNYRADQIELFVSELTEFFRSLERV